MVGPPLIRQSMSLWDQYYPRVLGRKRRRPRWNTPSCWLVALAATTGPTANCFAPSTTANQFTTKSAAIDPQLSSLPLTATIVSTATTDGEIFNNDNAIHLVAQWNEEWLGASGDTKRVANLLNDIMCTVNNGNVVDSPDVHRLLQIIMDWAFQPRLQQRVPWGLRLLEWQVSLQLPIPVSTWQRALKATSSCTSLEGGVSPAQASYRILQRLLVGRAGRYQPREAHFHAVLNAFANAGQMTQAQRLVQLQQRVGISPSAVTFSILFKGHGRSKNFSQLQLALEQSRQLCILQDTVMMNSLFNAYINCHALSDARTVFDAMISPGANPRANGRTYNTYLKGLAMSGALSEALEIGQQIQAMQLWDSVTTNTLVQAAVMAQDWGTAEHLLKEHTIQQEQGRKYHPNIEAYTDLLDGYAKNYQLDKAMAVLQTMRQRGVEPNEVTYTCLLAGFGKVGKVAEAQRMLQFMRHNAIPVTCVTYNALLSGLVSSDGCHVADASCVSMDHRVDAALHLMMRDMIKSGIRPNAVTVSTVVCALGRCSTARVEEAKALVVKLERDGVIPVNDLKVVTSLIQTLGAAQDIVAALKAFQSLDKADLVAVNAFLNVCCTCGKDRLALETFDHYFVRKAGYYGFKPDVITFTVLISAMLKKTTTSSLQKAQDLYKSMKADFSVVPDTSMVDVILKAIIKTGRTRNLSKTELSLVACVLRDAEHLRWSEGQLERRKRAVRAVLAERLRSVWSQNADLYGSMSPNEPVDEFLKRKGWNSIDSGFRIWGPARQSAPDESSTKPNIKSGVDRFLESKGWNEVDSGFRII